MPLKKKRIPPGKLLIGRLFKKKTRRLARKKKVLLPKRILKKRNTRGLKRSRITRRTRKPRSTQIQKPSYQNILYVVHTFYPETYTGTEKFVLNMARAMQSKGHRVKVVTHSISPLETFSHAIGNVVYREFDYEGLPVLAYRHQHIDPSESFDIGNKDLTLFAEEVIQKEKPTLIHIGHPMRAMEFMQTSVRLGINYVITLTDFWFMCPRGIMLRTDQSLCPGPDMGKNCMTHCQIPDVGKRLRTHIPLLKSAKKILSPSAALANLFKSNLPDVNVEVLNHGMNYETIRTNERVYQPGDPLTLFYGGSLNSHKGVDLILKAMSFIPSDRLQLKIYGSGPDDYTELLEQAAAADDRVTLCGPYTENDIGQLYQEVDVAIVPSIWYENYPLALHEALVSHVPALVSDIGGMAEKVQDGFNGFTFRTGDAGHLAERIVQLLDDPTLLNTFKANMRQVQIPAIEQEAAAYETIYNSLGVVKKKRPRRSRRRSGRTLIPR